MILIDLNCKENNKVYSIYHNDIEGLNLIYVHISFNLEYINLIINNLKYNNVLNKIKFKLYMNKLKKELLKIYNVNNYMKDKESVIFSNQFLKINENENKNQNKMKLENIILNELYKIFKDNVKLQVINKTNTFKTNLFKYLDKFNVKDKVCIFDNNITEKELISYVEKFKCIDIVNISKINSKNINNINCIIEKVNNEYGTTIKYITDYDLTKYNIIIINEEIDITKYLFNKYVYKLNLIDSDYDIYSKENKIVNKYKEHILIANDFSKNKIGQVFTGIDR